MAQFRVTEVDVIATAGEIVLGQVQDALAATAGLTLAGQTS
jgi:hypothetical protein